MDLDQARQLQETLAQIGRLTARLDKLEGGEKEKKPDAEPGTLARAKQLLDEGEKQETSAPDKTWGGGSKPGATSPSPEYPPPQKDSSVRQVSQKVNEILAYLRSCKEIPAPSFGRDIGLQGAMGQLQQEIEQLQQSSASGHMTMSRGPWGLHMSALPAEEGQGDGVSDDCDAVIVKPTANATDGGTYTGKIMLPPSTAADGDGDLAMPEGMTVGEDCLILNADENGLPTHWLKLNEYSVGIRVGYTDESTPKAIVLIPRGVARTATPSTLGAGTEGTTTADTKEWQRDAVAAGDVYGDCPLEMWVISRVVYDDAGDEILYKMTRKLTFAADGRLWKASAETRVTVDTPDDC